MVADICNFVLRPKVSHEVVTKNIPVTKLKFEKADIFMFCNVVESDFYFPKLNNINFTKLFLKCMHNYNDSKLETDM